MFAPLMAPSPQGPLTKKKAASNVYLDTEVMGSDPGIRSQSYKEGPQIPKSIQPDYNYPRSRQENPSTQAETSNR